MSLIKASELNPVMKYYKLLNREEKHNNVIFKTGLNVDILPLKTSSEPGGISFLSEIELLRFKIHCKFDVCWIREVSFKSIEDEPIYIEEEGKFKSHRLILGQSQRIDYSKGVKDYIRFIPEIISQVHDKFLKLINDSWKDLPYSELINSDVSNQFRVLWRDLPIEFKQLILKNQDLCLLAVIDNYPEIKHIPIEFFTPKLCLYAINFSGHNLQFIPDKFKTPELCLKAISSSCFGSLSYVPTELKTPELCKIAVKIWGTNIQHVPTELITPELCLLAFSKPNSCECVLKFIPEELKTPELCMIAVKSHCNNINYVPKNFRTTEIYLEAIKNGMVDIFETIPKNMLTPEICKIALETEGSMLQSIPEELKTQELCNIAVENNGLALLDVPDKFRTKEMCIKSASDIIDDKFDVDRYWLREFIGCLLKQLQSN